MESAAIEHVAYAGTGGSATVELNRITGKTDGYLDAVHARRDALAADLVVLVVPMDSGTCGQAWLLTPPVSASDASFGFSVVRPDCARVESHVRTRDGPQPGSRARPGGSWLRQRIHQHRRRLPDDHGVRQLVLSVTGTCQRVRALLEPDRALQQSADRVGDAEQRPSDHGVRAGGVRLPHPCGSRPVVAVAVVGYAGWQGWFVRRVGGAGGVERVGQGWVAGFGYWCVGVERDGRRG